VRGGATEEGAAAAARAATRGLEWKMVDVEGKGQLLEHPKLAEVLGERFDSSTEKNVQITQQGFDEWNLGGADGGGGGGGGGLGSNCFVRVACRDGKERRWVVYEGEVDGSRVPPEWHAWLHHTVAVPPVNGGRPATIS
jgi:hypothetical protein